MISTQAHKYGGKQRGCQWIWKQNDISETWNADGKDVGPGVVCSLGSVLIHRNRKLQLEVGTQ